MLEIEQSNILLSNTGQQNISQSSYYKYFENVIVTFYRESSN